MTCVDIIISAWLTLNACVLDRADTPPQRLELYRPVAEAICSVESSWEWRAYLAEQAYTETKLCRYILEGRCLEGPRNQRCDDGRAAGPWQNWKRWCPGAWRGSTQERLTSGALCCLRNARRGMARCGTWEGAFFAQGGKPGCSARWAAKRAWARVELLNLLLRGATEVVE